MKKFFVDFWKQEGKRILSDLLEALANQLNNCISGYKALIGECLLI